MSYLVVQGCGVVSPAGWGIPAFTSALERGLPVPTRDLAPPGRGVPLRVRTVPPPLPRPPHLNHSRLRRASPISQYASAAAIECLNSQGLTGAGQQKLGLILCVTCGCVNYSRRFYSEALNDPGTASPLVFPETVFNAPASHICSLLQLEAISYTLVGDQGTFLQGIALAAEWLESGVVEGCIVIGADEIEWLVGYAVEFLDKQVVLSEGAGAVFLSLAETTEDRAVLSCISSPQLYTRTVPKTEAARRVRAEMGQVSETELLCDGLQGALKTDKVEAVVWRDWQGPRISPRLVLGEGLMAGAAWQCIAAVNAVQSGRHASAVASLIGSNQQAIAARFQSRLNL